MYSSAWAGLSATGCCGRYDAVVNAGGSIDNLSGLPDAITQRYVYTAQYTYASWYSLRSVKMTLLMRGSMRIVPARMGALAR